MKLIQSHQNPVVRGSSPILICLDLMHTNSNPMTEWDLLKSILVEQKLSTYNMGWKFDFKILNTLLRTKWRIVL